MARRPALTALDQGIAGAPAALNRQEFGRRLYNLMLQKNWRQADLARASGCSRDSISKYIRGTNFPDAKNLKFLAEIFKMTAEELLPNTLHHDLDSQLGGMHISQSQSDPDKLWLRMSRAFDMDAIADIIQVVRDHDKRHPRT